MERPAAEPQPELPRTDDDRTAGPENLDLVSIGLAVFFVSLLLIVGALVVLPNIL